MSAQAIRTIQAMKRELGLDEEDYRAMLVRVTGKNSLRAMDGGQLGQVITDMRAKGGGSKKRLDGPYGGKLQALWLSGWNLGLVRNPANEALLAFVKGQTGIDHTRFLRNAADARKAVEALKKWLERAGVDWSEYTEPQDCVLAAQLRVLKQPKESVGLSAHNAVEAAIGRVVLMGLLGERIRALSQAGA